MSKPKLQFGCYPKWWHIRGLKMLVTSFEPEKKHLVISATAARLEIKQNPKGGWFVTWQVVDSYPSDTKSQGKKWFNDEHLAAAFGLSTPQVDESDLWLIEEYGGDVAYQGKFIRWQNYLNIPCPGTAHDGDPNISLELDDDIKNAIRKMLSL